MRSPLPRTCIHIRLSVGWSYFKWKGELDTLRAVLQSLPLTGDDGMIGDKRLVLLLWERRPDSLLSLLPVIHPATDTTPRGHPYAVWTGPRGRRASEATPLQLASTSIRFWCW